MCNMHFKWLQKIFWWTVDVDSNESFKDRMVLVLYEHYLQAGFVLKPLGFEFREHIAVQISVWHVMHDIQGYSAKLGQYKAAKWCSPFILMPMHACMQQEMSRSYDITMIVNNNKKVYNDLSSFRIKVSIGAYVQWNKGPEPTEHCWI